MNSEENNQGGGDDLKDGTGEGESTSDVVTLKREEYDKILKDMGSLKRENKDLKKPKETPIETPEKNQKLDDALLQRMEKIAFKQHSISHEDDIELARKTAKKWNMDIEDVLEDGDFQVKLKKQQDSRANVEATSGVKGESGMKTGGKSKADFWINSNTPPTDTDVETHKISRAELSKIMGHFIKNKGSNKIFYND